MHRERQRDAARHPHPFREQLLRGGEQVGVFVFAEEFRQVGDEVVARRTRHREETQQPAW
ncbi:hypothetical protein [Lentzea roselyniae]|uniref:hypothetical protein n=1 Tax=Lentzea roselyniae TaxID=531940 RepID=UPI0031F80810